MKRLPRTTSPFENMMARAGRVFGEGVVHENVVVRIHVVQAVADVVDEVVLDARIVREREVNAVARVADFVAADQIAFAIPLVNAVAAAIGDERGVAVLRAVARCLFRPARWRRQGRLACDAVVENLRAGNFLEIKPWSESAMTLFSIRRAIAGDEDGRVIVRSDRKPEPVMRSPRSVTSSAAIVTTLPVPLPRISAPRSPTSVSGLLMTIGPA